MVVRLFVMATLRSSLKQRLRSWRNWKKKIKSCCLNFRLLLHKARKWAKKWYLLMGDFYTCFYADNPAWNGEGKVARAPDGLEGEVEYNAGSHEEPVLERHRGRVTEELHSRSGMIFLFYPTPRLNFRRSGECHHEHYATPWWGHCRNEPNRGYSARVKRRGNIS